MVWGQCVSSVCDCKIVNEQNIAAIHKVHPNKKAQFVLFTFYAYNLSASALPYFLLTSPDSPQKNYTRLCVMNCIYFY